MIYIIGTAHARTQMWSDAIRNGECLDTDARTVEQNGGDHFVFNGDYSAFCTEIEGFITGAGRLR